MFLQEMWDQIAEEARNSGDTTFNGRMTRWINMSQIFLAQNYVFEDLKRYATVNTAIGAPDVILQSDFLWAFQFVIPTQNRRIYPEAEDQLSYITPKYRTMQGTITHYYLSGGHKIGLYHVPAEIVSIEYPYQKRPTKFTGSNPSTETSELPEEWHEMICLKALEKAYRYEGNGEAHARNQVDQLNMLKSLSANRYRRPDLKIQMGPVGRGMKPGRPRFPGNYPRIS